MEKLDQIVTTALILEQRVPEGFSATRDEHQWHAVSPSAVFIVDDMKPSEVFLRAEAMLKDVPDRNDTHYRVILRVRTSDLWVLQTKE